MTAVRKNVRKNRDYVLLYYFMMGCMKECFECETEILILILILECEGEGFILYD